MTIVKTELLDFMYGLKQGRRATRLAALRSADAFVVYLVKNARTYAA